MTARPLHLHQSIHQHHVVVEVRHDPERPAMTGNTIRTPSTSTLLMLSGPVVVSCAQSPARPAPSVPLNWILESPIGKAGWQNDGSFPSSQFHQRDQPGDPR